MERAKQLPPCTHSLNPHPLLWQVPVAYGGSLQAPHFTLAGHGTSEGTILVRCPALAQLAADRASAAAAHGAAAAAALAGAAEQLVGSYGPLSALVTAAAELDVLAGFAALSETAPPGAAYCRPVFEAAAVGGSGGGSGAEGTPPLHFKGLW